MKFKDTNPRQIRVIKYKENRNLASTPEEAVFRNLFPGRDYSKRTDEQMDKVQEWIEKNSPGWNSKS